ncbi:permease [bacterium]
MAKDIICGMDVNEKTGLHLDYKGQKYYFCSNHCMEKFIEQNNISDEELAMCNVCEAKEAKWYLHKVFIIAYILILIIVLSFYFEFLIPFRENIWMYFKRIYIAVILGLVVGGVINEFIPREYISKILSQKKKRTIFYSVILGFAMSACSHGILAIAIQLYKKGASVPSVISFLLASPWANLPLTILFFSFFGMKAIFIVVCAIAIAVITGLIYQFLDREKLIEHNPNTVELHESFTIVGDFKERYKAYKFTKQQMKKEFVGIIKGAISLGDMILWWILLGIGLASLSAAYVPQGIFQSYMGPNILGVFVTLGLAAILEVCSESTSPLAFEIYRQSGAFGNAFVFLMGGVVTDYTEIGLLWSNIGKRTALWLPVITVPQVVLLGILANNIF